MNLTRSSMHVSYFIKQIYSYDWWITSLFSSFSNKKVWFWELAVHLAVHLILVHGWLKRIDEARFIVLHLKDIFKCFSVYQNEKNTFSTSLLIHRWPWLRSHSTLYVDHLLFLLRVEEEEEEEEKSHFPLKESVLSSVTPSDPHKCVLTLTNDNHPESTAREPTTPEPFDE